MKTNETIETIFKVEPPLTELKDGFGYIGVVLRNKETDKIQCHVCGEWVSFMGSHVKKHKINLLEYRKKFGLPLSFPLCSIKFSRAISKSAQSQERKQRCRDLAKISQKKAQLASRNRKNKSNWMYGFKNAARNNMYGTCEEQLRKRYEIVADLVGGNPDYDDFCKHDKSIWSAISRRYGTMNKFREQMGYEINKHKKPVETIQIIAKIIDYFEKFKQAPTCNYFRTGEVTMTAIYNHFGSFKRALACAGIHEKGEI